MSRRKDISGIIHNSILPLEFVREKNTHAIWKCMCLKCDKVWEVTYSNIVSGNTKSCASCGQKKLSRKDNENIYDIYTKGWTMVEIAELYGVGRITISASLKKTRTEKWLVYKGKK